MIDYNSRAWYWRIDATGEIYSSASGAVVPTDDPAYQAWEASGGAPTTLPDAASLDDVLTRAGLPVSGFGPTAIPASVSRRQFFQAAAQKGVITQSDALALFATGALPANLSAAIAALPVNQRFAAQIAVLGSTAFERVNPLIIALGAAMGQTPAQIDALFILAATL